MCARMHTHTHTHTQTHTHTHTHTYQHSPNVKRWVFLSSKKVSLFEGLACFSSKSPVNGFLCLKMKCSCRRGGTGAM